MRECPKNRPWPLAQGTSKSLAACCSHPFPDWGWWGILIAEFGGQGRVRNLGEHSQKSCVFLKCLHVQWTGHPEQVGEVCVCCLCYVWNVKVSAFNALWGCRPPAKSTSAFSNKLHTLINIRIICYIPLSFEPDYLTPELLMFSCPLSGLVWSIILTCHISPS
jgi:hypothetical protein